MKQTILACKKEERAMLLKALSVIGKRNKDGAFSKKAKDAQAMFHSSISILRRLRQKKVINHLIKGKEIDVELLSKNDGFPEIDDFFKFFEDKRICPKVIHWTDLKY